LDFSFQTERLAVDSWYAEAFDEHPLRDVVMTILTPSTTQALPPNWQGDYDEDRAGEWIAQRDEEGATLLVVEQAANAPVGLMILFLDDEHEAGPRLRIGYILGESAWGRGLASELLAGFVDWAERKGRVASLVAGVGPENIASQRVLEKNGFHALSDVQSNGDLLYEYRID
jgi:RimJ/RimL family protein N-acetyltransferase